MGQAVPHVEDHAGLGGHVDQEVRGVHEGHVDHHGNHEAHEDLAAYDPCQGEACLDLVGACEVHLGLQGVHQDGYLDGYQVALQDPPDLLVHQGPLAAGAEGWSGSCFAPQTD